MLRCSLVLLLFVSACGAELEDQRIVRARIESCEYRLKQFKQVTEFVREDINLYPDTVTFKEVYGVTPIMKFLNAAGQVVEEIPLPVFPRDRCNLLLEKRGFFKKNSPTKEAKEEL